MAISDWPWKMDSSASDAFQARPVPYTSKHKKRDNVLILIDHRSTSLPRNVSRLFAIYFRFMSFGYRVGDFVALVKLTKTVLEKIKESPSYVRDAQNEYVP